MIDARSARYRALLLDLDGTILDLDIYKFIPVYIDALAERFVHMINKDDFIRHLFASTKKMTENTDALKTNRTVFYEEFCPGIGYDYADIEPIVEDFYRNEFPNLHCWSREHPQALPLIKAARRKKLTLVLATNPIFPAAAILERLSWSGLSPDNFHLITTMDNMHFCKPKAEYYLEISTMIGCPPRECLMAGNDTEDDLCASSAGMDTFLVEDFLLQHGPGEPVCDYRGSLADLVSLVEKMQ